MSIEIIKKYIISEKEILELIKAHLEKTLGVCAPQIFIEDIKLSSPHIDSFENIDITAEYTHRYTQMP